MLNQLSHRGTLSCFKKFSDLAWRFPSPLDREPGPSVRVTRIQTHAFLVHPDALGKWEWREYPGVSAPFESCLNDQVPLLRKPVRGWAAEEGWCPNRATRQLIPRLCCHTSPAPSLLCHKFDQQRVPSIAKPAPVQLRKMSFPDCPTEVSAPGLWIRGQWQPRVGLLSPPWPGLGPPSSRRVCAQPSVGLLAGRTVFAQKV